MCLGSTAPDAGSMPVWVEGNVIAVQPVGPGISGVLDALYQHIYPNGWNRLRNMWLKSAFVCFYDRVWDERVRGTLRMAFALLRIHIAERKAWARERRELLVKGISKYRMRLLRGSLTALRVSASKGLWAPALRKLWAPAQYKQRLRSWNNSLACVIFTHWKQRIQRRLAWKRSCAKCAKDAEAWLQRAMAIYFAREQREALTRYHTCRQARHSCPLEHVVKASGVKLN